MDDLLGQNNPVLVGSVRDVDAQIQIQLAGLEEIVQIGTVAVDEFDGDIFMGGMIIFPDIREKALPG